MHVHMRDADSRTPVLDGADPGSCCEVHVCVCMRVFQYVYICLYTRMMLILALTEDLGQKLGALLTCLNRSLQLKISRNSGTLTRRNRRFHAFMLIFILVFIRHMRVGMPLVAWFLLLRSCCGVVAVAIAVAVAVRFFVVTQLDFCELVAQ
jgi:hypothetical protein